MIYETRRIDCFLIAAVDSPHRKFWVNALKEAIRSTPLSAAFGGQPLKISTLLMERPDEL